MSKVLVNESSLTGIADAIRGKNGSTTTYKPSEMAAAITAISGGGEPTIEALSITANGTYTAPDGVDGYSPVTVNVPQDGGPPESAFVISGNCSYRFARNGWNWFIDQYGDRITMNNSVNCDNMFYKSDNLESIPFSLKFIGGDSTFYRCEKLKYIADFDSFDAQDTINYMFAECRNLRYLPNFNNPNFRMLNINSNGCSCMFLYCTSLRQIPKELLKNLYNKATMSVWSFYKQFFYRCYCLDEVDGIGICEDVKITSNVFETTFDYCSRLKNIIFNINDDGTVKTVQWKNQTIDCSSYLGYAQNKNYIINYNSGITADKQVTDDATYQALKNDPDWFTCDVAYSRYNHDSAVATINSLPDTSAYLASAGGTNTIKFKGDAGSATDGGAINTLTEEEIAVATAKGWTVSLV